jgi:luciferase-type oxidoreductase
MNEHLPAIENAEGLTQASTSDLEGHCGWSRTFRKGRMSLGFFFPIEAFTGDMPALDRPEVLARSADEAGYAALWVRDVPIRDPHFGDVGQIMDPWVFASWIAAHTSRIAIGTGSVILPLRPTMDMAKASASLDCMSGGRLLFGVASGDRPSEFPLYGRDHSLRGDDFRRSVEEVRDLHQNLGPLEMARRLSGTPLELLPRPPAGRVPLLVTGFAQQALDWIALHADAWMTYPREASAQAQTINRWNEAVQSVCGRRMHKPVMQSLYIDLLPEADAAPRPMHLGLRLGRTALVALLSRYQAVGVGHTAFNLKYGSRDARSVMDELTEHVLPHFLIEPWSSDLPDGRPTPRSRYGLT